MVRGFWYATSILESQSCSSCAWTHLMYPKIKAGFWGQNYRSCPGVLAIRCPCSGHKKEHMHVNLADTTQTLHTPCPTEKVNFTCTVPGAGKAQFWSWWIIRNCPFHAESLSALLFQGHHLNGKRHYHFTNAVKTVYAEMHFKLIITDSPSLMLISSSTTTIIIIKWSGLEGTLKFHPLVMGRDTLH